MQRPKLQKPGICPADGLVTLEEIQREYTARVLAATGGNKVQAAKILGVDRRTLYRREARQKGRAA
jgi:DNA-binding NtrC family response regulator